MNVKGIDSKAMNSIRSVFVLFYMNSPDPKPAARTHGGGTFDTTHWSVILVAAQEAQPESMEALEILCRAYWKPLHAFVRRSGYSSSDADDVTQGFFAHLIRSELVKKVEAEGGKFRSFLLVSLRNFMISERARAQAQKRGGGQPVVSIDGSGMELEDNDSPDVAFDKAWALTVLEEAIQILLKEYEEAGRKAIFDELRLFLLGEKASITYPIVAERLGTSEGAVKMMVQRMRRRYHECLKLVVGRTVRDPEQVDEELRHLAQALK